MNESPLEITKTEREFIRARLALRRRHERRDAEIARAYIAGESMAGIASAHKITRQRVQQILHRLASRDGD